MQLEDKRVYLQLHLHSLKTNPLIRPNQTLLCVLAHSEKSDETLKQCKEGTSEGSLTIDEILLLDLTGMQLTKHKYATISLYEVRSNWRRQVVVTLPINILKEQGSQLRQYKLVQNKGRECSLTLSLELKYYDIKQPRQMLERRAIRQAAILKTLADETMHYQQQSVLQSAEQSQYKEYFDNQSTIKGRAKGTSDYYQPQGELPQYMYSDEKQGAEDLQAITQASNKQGATACELCSMNNQQRLQMKSKVHFKVSKQLQVVWPGTNKLQAEEPTLVQQLKQLTARHEELQQYSKQLQIQLENREEYIQHKNRAHQDLIAEIKRLLRENHAFQSEKEELLGQKIRKVQGDLSLADMLKGKGEGQRALTEGELNQLSQVKQSSGATTAVPRCQSKVIAESCSQEAASSLGSPKLAKAGSLRQLQGRRGRQPYRGVLVDHLSEEKGSSVRGHSRLLNGKFAAYRKQHPSECR